MQDRPALSAALEEKVGGGHSFASRPCQPPPPICGWGDPNVVQPPNHLTVVDGPLQLLIVTPVSVCGLLASGQEGLQIV